MYRVECTPELAEDVARYIRAGVFDWVAAAAVGISKQTFWTWSRSDKEEHAFFRAKVEEARAQARAKCEIVVHEKDPLAWLMRGPGRDRPDAPGWASQVAVTGKNGGALEQVITQADKPVEDYSKLTVEELRQLRALREKVRNAAAPEAESAPEPAGE